MTNWKKFSLTVAIAIIFALFIGFGIETFYESPKYSDFCNHDSYYTAKNESACLAEDGEWENYDKHGLDNEYLCHIDNESNNSVKLTCEASFHDQSTIGYCNNYENCSKEYRDVSKEYNKIVFIICAIFGLAAIITGSYLTKDSVGTGLLSGGVITVIYGTIRYWEGLGDVIRFLLLGLVLALLIWAGYKKIKD